MTSDTAWADGYVTEVEYTSGHYKELCPGLLRFACLSAGFASPKQGSLHYLELGFGHGLSLNLHAAAEQGVFWGTDFNRIHVANANAMARAAGSGATLLNASFAELAARPDLPEYDIICLHGIWSWVSEESRRIIMEIIGRSLRPGGLVYVSYNCSVGWASAAPLRDLMKLHHERSGPDPAAMLARVENAIAFCHQVADAGALSFTLSPRTQARLQRLKTADRRYLAHEYFNENWNPTTFQQVVRSFDDANLTFVASATLLDHVDGLNIRPEGQKLLAGIRDPILNQSVRDHLVNQQFRRDIFIKEPRRLTPAEQADGVRGQAFVLVSNPADVPMKVTGALGESQLQEALYRPVLDALADHQYRPKTIVEMAADARLKHVSLPHLGQAVFVLCGTGHVHPAQTVTEPAQKSSRSLNRYLCERSQSSSATYWLASPLTGSGIRTSRLDQLLVLAIAAGNSDVQSLTTFAWDVLQRNNKSLQKDGRPLSAEESMMEIRSQASRFMERRLPLLRALEVV